MKIAFSFFKRLDKIITKWLADHSLLFLRVALGIIFIWFGALKFFPNLSSAEDLASRTIGKLTFGSIPDKTSIILLATWECLIGLGLITVKWMRITLALLFFQIIGTILPLFFFPDEVFVRFPYVPTLEGQYIIKNLVIIAAAMVLGATVRGGAVVADPKIAEQAKEREEMKADR